MFKETVLNISKADNSRNEILSQFSSEQQEEIEKKRKILSSLAFYIGKDFNIPVELNSAGNGWHWDFKNNIIRIDPIDLLEKSMDYLRFVICHEGGHRRISRTDFIPLETWNQPGFSFMMNSIEDPRDNNFVADSYHKFGEQMISAYGEDMDIEGKYKKQAKKKLGYTPRFMQAGLEYIKQWFFETIDKETSLSPDLPADIKEMLNKTLLAARSSWLMYPSKEMADGREFEQVNGKNISGEELIREYAKASYTINREKIWPEFQKLVEKDLEDQKMQEFMKDMQTEKGTLSAGAEISRDLRDKLSPEEEKILEEEIEKVIDAEKNKNNGKAGKIEEKDEGQDKNGKENKETKAIDLDSLPNELKKKIKEYINSLSDEKKQELEEKAVESLKGFEAELNDDLEGKLVEKPGGEVDESYQEKSEPSEEDKNADEHIIKSRIDQEQFRKNLENIFNDSKDDAYSDNLMEIASMIDQLSGDLRDIFIQRKQQTYEAEYRSGKKWNVSKRIKEKISDIPLFKSEAREQKNIESEEKDYAITLMVDLSGSMSRGGKIEEAFKSIILLSETLNDLNIKFEVIGFQDILLQFKKFDDDFNDDMRDKMNQILLEVNDSNPDGNNNCGDNNDGECLLVASEHLEKQMSKNKFLIILSDGEPFMDSGRKSRSQLHRELKDAVKSIGENTQQHLIGIGLLSDAVEKYYENNIANVGAKELSEILGAVIREIVENY